MRIVFVNSAWPQMWGGGEKWTVEAAEWFFKRGDEICVVGRPHSKLIAAARGRQLSIHETGFGGDFNPVAMLRAKKILEDFRADLTVVNFNKEAWQFGLAARRLKIPIVARHGFPILRASKHHYHLAEHYLSRLVVNAHSIKRHYASLKIDVSRVSIIHNGVRLPPQRTGELRRRFNITDDETLVLAAGRLESQKQFDKIIEFAHQLVPDHPHLIFLIAGEGPLRNSLEEEAEARGLTDYVRFTGFLPDLAEIMGDADLFVLTSDEEGTPNVLLEAMAAQVPCVAFAVGAVPEILSGDLKPNAIEPDNVTALIRRVKKLLEDKELRMTVAQQMRARTENEFSLDHSMSQFAELFDHLAHTE